MYRHLAKNQISLAVAVDAEAKAAHAENDSPQRGHVRRHSVSHLVMQALWKLCRHGKATTESVGTNGDKQTEHSRPMNSSGDTSGNPCTLSTLAVGLATVSSKRRSKS